MVLDDDSDSDVEDMAMLGKKFKKFIKFQNQSKDAKKLENFKNNKDSKVPETQNDEPKVDESNRCFECEGYGHKVNECPIRLEKERSNQWFILPP